MGCCCSQTREVPAEASGLLQQRGTLLRDGGGFGGGGGLASLKPVAELGVPEIDRLFAKGGQIMREADSDRRKVGEGVAQLLQAFNDDFGDGEEVAPTGEVAPHLLQVRLRQHVQRLREAVNEHGAASLMAIVNENSPVMLSVLGLELDLPPDMRKQLDAFEALGDALHNVISRVRKRRQELEDIVTQVEAKNLDQLVKANRLRAGERRRLPRRLLDNKTMLRQFKGVLEEHRTQAAALANVLEAVARQTADSVTSN